MTNTPQNWEEEFDIQFPCVQVRADDTDNDKLVKDFIRDQRKQACREMIEYMKKSIPPEDLKLIYFDFETVTSKAEEFLKKMS
jgi:hypothetical protein